MKLFNSLLVMVMLSACGQNMDKSALIYKTSLATVAVASSDGHGSGVFLFYKNKDFILTNAHVCLGLFTNPFSEKYIIDYTGQGHPTYAQNIIGYNGDSDLCALSFIPPNYMIELPLAPASPPAPFEILVLGYPMSDPMTASFGFAMNYSEDWLHKDDISNYISARTFPGNSGSPVVDMQGRLVGLINEGDSQTNNGRMVTLNNIKNFIDGLR